MSNEKTIGRPLDKDRKVGKRRGKPVLTLALEKFGFDIEDDVTVEPDPHRKGDVSFRIRKKRRR